MIFVRIQCKVVMALRHFETRDIKNVVLIIFTDVAFKAPNGLSAIGFLMLYNGSFLHDAGGAFKGLKLFSLKEEREWSSLR